MAVPRPRRWLVAMLVATVSVVAPAADALAAWTATGGGAASAASTSVPAGPTPSVVASGRNVTVTWPARALASGDAVSGYRVRRVASDGSVAAIGASCDTVQTGLTCTEAAVAPGTWSYGVTAVAGSWSGTEGARTSVVVAPATFTLSATAPVVASPGTVTGTVDSFVGPATLSFRLDNAVSGTLLSATPASVPANGRADVTITLPAGVSDGSHTIFAIGGGDVVGASVVVDATRPQPVNLVTADGGGTTGAAQAGDSVSVTYSEPLLASSICPAWADDGGVKTLTSGVTVTINGAGGLLGTGLLSTDVLSVAAPGCGGGGLRFGTVDLGAGGYVRSGATVTFGASGTSSTVRWDPATSTLRIVLGTASASPPTLAVSLASTATYTPDAALTDLRGLAITGTTSRSARHL